MYRFLIAYELTRAPGEQFQYSNLGFALLARALMEATGDLAYQRLVGREIGGPLAMVDTRIVLTADERARQAQGYDRWGQPAPFEMRTWPAFNGAGALRSTMTDMMKFLAFNMGLAHTSLDSLLPVLQARRHAAGRRDHYVGLAWQMSPLGVGDRMVIWKNGETAGFFAYIGFVRETGTGVVILSNQAVPQGRVAVRILRLLNAAENGKPNAPH